jgi:hypothetical protein
LTASCRSVEEGQPQHLRRGAVGGLRDVDVAPGDVRRVELGCGLKDTYFTQVLLPAWEREHWKIDGLYYEALGTLHHPHDPGDTRLVRLGTREVLVYEPSDCSYDKVMIAEKAGLWPVPQASRIADEMDMAIVTSGGFGTTALRELIEPNRRNLHEAPRMTPDDPCRPPGWPLRWSGFTIPAQAGLDA